MNKKTLAKTLLISLILLLATSASAAVVESIVATVNGEAITSSDLNKAMKDYGPVLRKEFGVTGTKLRAKVLNQLIDDKIFEDALKKSKITVDDHEIDASINRILRSSRISIKALEDKLHENGMTMSEYKKQLTDKLIRTKFIDQNVGRKISISEQELKLYFKKNMDDFKSASAVKLIQISIPFTNTMTNDDFEKLEKFSRKIANAAKTTNNYEALAKQYNKKPYEVSGGSLGVVKIEDLNPYLAQVATQIKVGEASQPIPTNTGLYIIKVLDRAQTSPKDFESVRDQVNGVLYDKKSRQALRDYIQELRKSAHIDIKGLGSH